MVKVNASKCICGVCKTEFQVDWEITCIDSFEREMGEETEYEGIADVNCPNCGNRISGELQFWEYPVGALNLCEIRLVRDSADSEETSIETPDVYFYDL